MRIESVYDVGCVFIDTDEGIFRRVGGGYNWEKRIIEDTWNYEDTWTYVSNEENVLIEKLYENTLKIYGG